MKQLALFFLVIFILVASGCDVAKERSLIPKQKLSPQQERIIKETITKNDHFRKK